MIDRKQFLGLMAGAPILMRAGMAEAVELPDAQEAIDARSRHGGQR